MPKPIKDAIYSQPQSTISDFRFDQSVAEVFPDMIQRSVPGYSTIIDNIGLLAGKYATEGSSLYDLGCSLGAVTLSMRRYVADKQCQIIAVDNSSAMVERCQLHMDGFRSTTPVSVICDDIQNIAINNASVVVLNFTLQFIEPEKRQAIIAKIFSGMQPGGILVLSEKLRHPSDSGNELLIELHHEFKRRNGYSELEISQKRTALENVMRLDTYNIHQERLFQVGFSEVVLWYKCFNFSSLIAIK
jgi:tRNA (cmo5U34)-methyltransferase